jgi:drug/metabolite transporter (DMT)-like permease
VCATPTRALHSSAAVGRNARPCRCRGGSPDRAAVLAFLTAGVVFVGGMGELIAEPTVDVPRAVLITAGVLWGVVAVIFVALGTAATRQRRGHRDAT